tara:strand:- start:517 stop:993 length:477 start_codon:yes stop_codon:yes gene_type:complete
MSTTTRIQRELELMEKESPYGCTVGICNNEIWHWVATIIGPENTPYHNGVFKLDIFFPSEYPFKAPKINFKTKIYHPNISSVSGSICIDILKDKWSPALTISKVLLSISSMLNDPNPDDPLEIDIANQFKNNYQLYLQTAKNWTLLYANDEQLSLSSP